MRKLMTLVALLVGLTVPAVGGAATNEESQVQAVYRGFLGRDPSASELEAGVFSLASEGLGAVVTSVSMSDEWLEVFVNDLYEQALGRKPDAAGRTYWVGLMRQGLPSTLIAANVLGSPEFRQLAGGTDEGVINRLYDRVLKRHPDATGRTFWLGQIGVMGDTGVGIEFFESPENRNRRVALQYQQLLCRAPDAAGRDYWAGVISGGRDIALSEFLATSAEFINNAVGGTCLLDDGKPEPDPAGPELPEPPPEEPEEPEPPVDVPPYNPPPDIMDEYGRFLPIPAYCGFVVNRTTSRVGNEDCLALIAIVNANPRIASDGPDHYGPDHYQGWLYYVDPCHWQGVYCDDEGYGVVGLWLSLFETLPIEMTNLTRLEFLQIEGVRNDAIPSVIGALSSLKSLTFFHGNVSELPGWFENLQNLESLHLMNQCIWEFPEILLDIPSLRFVDFWNNPISEAPPLPEGLEVSLGHSPGGCAEGL